MRKIIQITHTSLDGYTAWKNGELDRFENAGEHLSFVNKLLLSADSILFGRITYEMFESYWPAIENNPLSSEFEKCYSHWYNKATKLVLSNTLNELKGNNTILVKSDIVSTIEENKNKTGKNILLFGSPSVGQLLLQSNLIDEYWIFVNPVIFGTGIPMFAPSNDLKRLKLIGAKTISNGEVALHYEVKR
ncbi:dihydrofolate reductase family protein [Paradesertivirga mongoliensis]|uniref:Dihydrofolate reductase family protein n=1 Tax=Paradesertivirga mongoliensis TaxID=2100740 RepID=A0ABW4ZN81_9SPHI|nr:dihydrofolate reductase family protein [Pedobacter mongoliensis]